MNLPFHYGLVTSKTIDAFINYMMTITPHPLEWSEWPMLGLLGRMERYIFKRRYDGIYIFDLNKTWSKLVLAARVIAAIEDPQVVQVDPRSQ
jgi:hypothetical protein